MKTAPASKVSRTMPVVTAAAIILTSILSVRGVGASTRPSPTATTTTTTSFERKVDLLSMPPISMRHGIFRSTIFRWRKARALAELEQGVEDYNAAYIASCRGSSSSNSPPSNSPPSRGDWLRHRRLLVLPIPDEESFNPPADHFSHNHVQTGDKMSLPKNFARAVSIREPEVPYLFSVRRIPGVTKPRVQFANLKVSERRERRTGGRKMTDDDGEEDDDEEEEDKVDVDVDDEEEIITEYRPAKDIDMVVGGILDFRAPPCYIFVPLWMMRSLGLRPFDVVAVDLVETVPSGLRAKFRPHSDDFAADISNPQAVLETELRHYSSLTTGSTIAFDYNGKRYWFDVCDVRSTDNAGPDDDDAPVIKVQDSNIMTDFYPSRETAQRKRRDRAKKRREMERERQLEE